MPATIDDGLDGGDPELFSVFAVIALRRAGRVDNSEVPEVFERFIDAPFARSIRAENDSDEAEQDEDDAGPPASSSPANGTSSGPVSRTSSGRSATASPSGSGTPASATSVSLPAGSAT
jgi:hypothetical protein